MKRQPKKETLEIRQISKEEWEAEGGALFGPDKFKWKFVCPICGNVASVEDFRQFKDKGATPNSAYQECIGRYIGGRSAFRESTGRPCDYASYGLFSIYHTEVISDGRKYPVFEFARGGE